MEDPLGQARQALYARMENFSLSGLFTRPAVLVIAEDNAGELPSRALSQVCRSLMDSVKSGDTDVSGTINRVAEECGFSDMKQFVRQFHAATGWYPDEWYRSYGRDTML